MSLRIRSFARGCTCSSRRRGTNVTRHDEAAIAVGLFAFVFTIIPGFINRKNTTDIEFSRGLTKYRTVKRKPTSALRELVTAVAAGVIFGLLVWWNQNGQ
jgi:hypothetical protein